MLGLHCIKTWSSSQGAVALSSAEAEFYGMVEAVTRAKGLGSLAQDLGFSNISSVVQLGTDRSAAKSFVCRRGLGKMRHLDIRDLWLQKEVADGKLEVSKVPGTENPADLMTKYLSGDCIKGHLRRLYLVPSGSRPANAPVLCGVGGLFRYGSCSSYTRSGRVNFLTCNNDFLDSWVPL